MGVYVFPACSGCKVYLDLGPGYKVREIDLDDNKLRAIGKFVLEHGGKNCAVALVSDASFGIYRDRKGFEKST